MRTLTEEQKAKAQERRERFKALWKTISDMTDEQRQAIADKYGFVSCEGHSYSPNNHMLIAMQCPTASVLGGFRQWIKQGRAVRKGEHGIMIWVKSGERKGEAPQAQAEEPSAVEAHDILSDAPVTPGKPNGKRRSGFIVGTVFDISQTAEIGGQETENKQELESVAA